MSWWNQIKLVGFRERLKSELLRRLLPFWAVFQTDLAGLVRSWVARAWLALTLLVALIALLDHTDPRVAARDRNSQSTLVALFLHPVDANAGELHLIRELLQSYVLVWVSFVVLLTGGTIGSELGVVADSILSRGISRWQYFLGKLGSRFAVVLGIYAVVMVPTSMIIWLGAPAAEPAGDSVTQVSADTNSVQPIDPPARLRAPLSPVGISFALGRVAAVMLVVASCGIVCSSTFSSTVMAITVGLVSVYGAGIVLAILDVRYLSPWRMIQELPDVLRGDFVLTEQCWLVGGWCALAFLLALASGVLFARRDV